MHISGKDETLIQRHLQDPETNKSYSYLVDFINNNFSFLQAVTSELQQDHSESLRYLETLQDRLIKKVEEVQECKEPSEKDLKAWVEEMKAKIANVNQHVISVSSDSTLLVYFRNTVIEMLSPKLSQENEMKVMASLSSGLNLHYKNKGNLALFIF